MEISLLMPGYVLVQTLYDSVKIGSIYLPDSYVNPQPQQGIVLRVGSHVPLNKGDHVLMRQFSGIPKGRLDSEHRIVDYNQEIVATAVDRKLVPKANEVVILPDFATKYQQKSDLVYLPPTVLEDGEPVTNGTIVRVGSACRSVREGQYVVIPPNLGIEVGFIDTVYYILAEKDLLATITK